MASDTVSFPYEGRLFKSRNKKYAETVLFVPFFGGVQRELSRHVKFVTDLGYDAVVFDLEKTPPLLDFSQGITTPLKHWRELPNNIKVPINSKLQFGLKHVFADQIENMLNMIEGKKIIYSFSNPSAAAIEAMARRGCSDIAGFICDSGPSGKFIESFMNLCKYDWNIQLAPLRWALAPLLSVGWSPHLHKDLHPDIEKFPQGFKILSIRGWKDHLIPPDHIDVVFEPHHNIDWRKLALPEADHLVGLRDFRDEYAPVVEKFMKEISTDLKAHG